MKRLVFFLTFTLCLSSFPFGQTVTNPNNGGSSGKPIQVASLPAICVSGSSYQLTGSPYSIYDCKGADNFVARGTGSGSGTIAGQANGVIPLATAADTVGAQSALSQSGSGSGSTVTAAGGLTVVGDVKGAIPRFTVEQLADGSTYPCNAATVGRPALATNGNRGQRTCRNTVGSTYAWVDPDPRFNVRNFGGSGNGSDATIAALATIAAAKAAITLAEPYGGNTVYFPKGEYLITSQLLIDFSGGHVEGDGIRSTIITFTPASSGVSLFKFKYFAASPLYEGGIKKMMIRGTESTYQKIAIDLQDVSNIYIEEISVHNTFVGNNGNTATPSTGIKIAGRELIQLKNISINTNRPIWIAKNPNSGAFVYDLDSSRWDSIYLQAQTTTESSIYFDPSVSLNIHDLSVIGNSVITGGKYAVYVNDSGIYDWSGLRFSNLRWEQTGDDTGYSFQIDRTGTGVTYGILIENCGLASSSNGIRFRKAYSPRIIGGNYLGTSGSKNALDIDNTSYYVQTDNWFVAPGAGSSLGTMANIHGTERVSAAITALNPFAVYDAGGGRYFTNQMRFGSKTFIASNTLTLAGTDSTTMTFPTTSATVARTDAAQTFTGKQIVDASTGTYTDEQGNFHIRNTTTPTKKFYFGIDTALGANGKAYFGAAYTGVSNLPMVAVAEMEFLQPLTSYTAGAISIGSAANPFKYYFFAGDSGTPGSNNFKLTGTATAARTVTLPDASITVARSDAAQTFTGSQTIGGGSLNLTDAPLTATAGGTTTVNMSLGNIHTITFGAGNTTLALSNVTAGFHSFAFIQDGTGNRTVTFPSTMRDGTITLAIQPSPTATYRTTYFFQCDNTNCTLAAPVAFDGVGTQYVDLANNQSIAGVKTFNSQVVIASSLKVANLAVSATAPTVTSAGTSPSIPFANGTAAFTINVGSGGTATTVVLAMPAATNGWNCQITNRTAAAANRADFILRQTATTTTSVTIQSQSGTLGTALAFVANDILACICIAY